VADHDRLIASDHWIIEGNYSVCIPQRFARATSIIWLDTAVLGCVWRFINRSFFDTHRLGRIDGAKSEFSLSLIKYTLIDYPKKRAAYRRFLDQAPVHTHKILLTKFSDIRCLYHDWQLKRPTR
jgi:hypothetical protein